jgi:DNA-binding NtrC family response regulator
LNYSFPGNIRELQNIVERAVIMEKNEFMTLEFLSGSDPQPVQNICATAGRSSLEELERKHIEDVLTSVGYNKSHAAKILGIARKTLREKIQKYQLKAS